MASTGASIPLDQRIAQAEELIAQQDCMVHLLATLGCDTRSAEEILCTLHKARAELLKLYFSDRLASRAA
jgi:hypothetical protein